MLISELYFFTAGNVAAVSTHGRLPLEEGDLIDLHIRELWEREAICLDTILHRHDGPERVTIRRYLADRLREGAEPAWWQRKALVRR